MFFETIEIRLEIHTVIIGGGIERYCGGDNSHSIRLLTIYSPIIIGSISIVVIITIVVVITQCKVANVSVETLIIVVTRIGAILIVQTVVGIGELVVIMMNIWFLFNVATAEIQ